MRRELTLIGATAFALISVDGCGRFAGQPERSLSVWLLPLPGSPGGGAFLSPEAAMRYMIGESIPLDSVSFRPSSVQPERPTYPMQDGAVLPPRVSILTTFQGSRYHPETIRALENDSAALGAAAGAIAREAGERGANVLFIDLQGATSGEIRGLVAAVRAIADSARRYVPGGIGIILPPGDTAGYPTAILARVAPLLIARLYGEHRAGTAPGPLASPQWISRQLGMRAMDVGANRLVAEIPLFGYRWDRSGDARAVTFSEAQAMVRSEAGSFRRDPTSGFLTASGRDGWTVWISDARTMEIMIDAVRRGGVTRIALAGIDGADPEVWARLPAAVKR
ncbi:MAG: hypothetical protein ABI681_05910 [Gemmatimonadales bacterium]